MKLKKYSLQLKKNIAVFLYLIFLAHFPMKILKRDIGRTDLYLAVLNVGNWMKSNIGF